MTLGAYYANRPLEPISGLGAAPILEQTMADVAVNTMQSVLQSIQPIGVFIPWAAQISDVDWKVVAPDTRYALYPVTADVLKTVEQTAFGQPVGFVTVLSTRPLSLDTAKAMFEGTPFEYFSADASYREDDSKGAPTIYFVYWGRLRPQAQTIGTYSTLEQKVRAGGGQLSFPVYVNVPAGAQQPAIDFNLALRAQQGGGLPPTASPTATPAMPGMPAVAPTTAPPAAPVATPSSTAPTSGIGKVLIVLAVGGVAAYAGYRIVSSRKRRAVAA